MKQHLVRLICTWSAALLLTGCVGTPKSIAERIRELPDGKRPDAIAKALKAPELTQGDRMALYNIMCDYERGRNNLKKAVEWQTEIVRLLERETGMGENIEKALIELFGLQIECKMLTEAETTLARIGEIERKYEIIKCKDELARQALFLVERKLKKDREGRMIILSAPQKQVTPYNCCELELLCAKNDVPALLKRHRELCAIPPPLLEYCSSMPPYLRMHEIVMRYFKQKNDFKNLRIALNDAFLNINDPFIRLQFAAEIRGTWYNTQEYERATTVFLNTAETLRRQIETEKEKPESDYDRFKPGKEKRMYEFDWQVFYILAYSGTPAVLVIPYADRILNRPCPEPCKELRQKVFDWRQKTGKTAAERPL